MSGSVTAAAGQFIAPNPPSQQPSPVANDQFNPAISNPRGQVNAWGWPSGFDQPSPASNAAGPSRPLSYPGAAPLVSPALASANMFTAQTQQFHQQQHPHQQPQLHLQHQQHQQPQHFQQQQNQQHQLQQQHQQQQQQQQSQQQQQQQQQQNARPNQAKVTVYPPQPYGNPPAFTAPNHTSSPSNGAKPGTPNSSMMSKKRGASKSPDFEGKDKRSRPEDGVSSDNKAADAVADGRVWGEEATKLDVYVWDYLSRRGFNAAAKALMNEAGMTEPPEVPLKTPQGLLFEYWAIFWDVFAARSGRGGSEAAAYFEYQESRNMQRLAEASRKTEALEAQYQAPENNGRFPNIVVSGLNQDPNSAAGAAAIAGPNGRAAAPGGWNPAAMPQAQQQQLLITAAQRQNIPLHEIKNLTPASRMALINSMNPNNPANAQQVRPGMNNALMDPQMQARFQQQQALMRMQQQRQAGALGAMPGTPGVPGALTMAGNMQARPPMGPQQMPGAVGSPAPPTPGGTMDGRRSVPPGADGNRPDHMAGPPGVLAGGNQQPGQGLGGPQQQQPGQQPGQAPQPQHPQLTPQQQQAVMTQYQAVQAAMQEEYAKAHSTPNPAQAAEHHQNVKSYQNKATQLQNLLRAQANYQGGNGNGAQLGMPGQLVGAAQPRPPGLGGPGMQGPAASGSPASMANMTPQQRAAQIANAQAAAGRITPLMATHDPGLMASMMGPNSMPNGTGARPAPQQQQGGQPGQQGPAGGFQQPQQPGQQIQRPASAQDRAEDAHAGHFSALQMGSSPANMQRPGMQRASSQLGTNTGGMGPPGAASISSPSPRISATNLQQSSSQPGTNTAANATGGSPAASNVTNTPKLGSAEKGKKGNARQRKNSKAANTKTPVLTAASVPTPSGAVAGSANGAPGPTTPAANAATPASTSAVTPGRDAASKPDGITSTGGGPTSQPIDSAMPPPANPSETNFDGSNANPATNGIPNMDGTNAGSDGNAAPGNAEDFSMFGFGGSMNDIFDFDLSTDGTGGQGLGDAGWDSNFGNLFGSTTGQEGS